jgi:hypothetical protein
MDREKLRGRLDDIIEKLSRPLPPAELQHGWTEQSKTAMRSLFERMRADLTAGKELKSVPHYIAVVRGLDHWGIASGELFDSAANIGSLAKLL